MTDMTRSALAALGVLTICLAGCTPATESNAEAPLSNESIATSQNSTDATQASTNSNFWSHLRPYSASEVDPATDLADLADQSTAIVRGKVKSVSPGPSYPDTSDDGQVDKGETSFVTVEVEETLKGTSGDTVVVWLSGPGSDLDIPTDSFLWYLKPSERPDVMYPSSLSGVIGPDGNGLSTVLAPSDASFIIPASVESVSEMETATETLILD